MFQRTSYITLRHGEVEIERERESQPALNKREQDKS